MESAKTGEVAVENVQRRVIAAPPEQVAPMIDEIADRRTTVWPSPAWPPLKLDRGLEPGSRGGHGPMRYHVTQHEPGRRLTMAFADDLGLDGWHELRLEPHGPAATLLVHTISASPRGQMRWRWPLVIRWLHEALMQDLFDNAERRATGGVAGQPARWSTWVRVLRKILGKLRAG